MKKHITAKLTAATIPAILVCFGVTQCSAPVTQNNTSAAVQKHEEASPAPAEDTPQDTIIVRPAGTATPEIKHEQKKTPDYTPTETPAPAAETQLKEAKASRDSAKKAYDTAKKTYDSLQNSSVSETASALPEEKK